MSSLCLILRDAKVLYMVWFSLTVANTEQQVLASRRVETWLAWDHKKQMRTRREMMQ